MSLTLLSRTFYALLLHSHFVSKLVNEQSEQFFVAVLQSLQKAGIPFLIGGTYAFREYTGIQRQTKDLDVFCKAGDYQRILQIAKDQGYKTEITDARWLAKIKKNTDFIDLIFASASGLVPVDDTWFDNAKIIEIMKMKVKAISPVEFVWSKSYVADRDRFEGPDVNHVILRQGKHLDWKRLLIRMESHWELLLERLISFRFVYPSERQIIPKWLMEELISRVQQQFSLPEPKDKICRGPLLSRFQYETDTEKWGFKSIT